MSNAADPIIIITARNDGHVPYVAKYLDQPPIIIDPAAVLQQTELSFMVQNDSVEVIYNGVPIPRPKAVWYRKPKLITAAMLPPMDEQYQEYSLSALQQFTAMLRGGLFPEAFWLPDYWAMMRATNKPWQMAEASKLGFNVPAAIFTSDPKAAKQFIQKHGKAIVKSLAHVFPPGTPQSAPVFQAQVVQDSPDLRLDGMHVAPSIFQELIDAEVDVRVHVIDQRVIAATITGEAIDKPGSAVRDWRAAHYAGTMVITPFELPEDIAQKCMAHVAAMGLKFGVLDLILDKQGTWWFIENNPSGEWAFVEAQTKQPIGKSIAELLTTSACQPL